MASSSFSLRDLLSRESKLHQQRQSQRRKHSPSPPLCSDAGRSSDRRRHRAPAPAFYSSRTTNSASNSNRSSGSNPRSLPPRNLDDEDDGDPAAGETALRAVVAILAGYAGRFLRDAAFRRRLREKCAACVAAASRGAAHAVLANLELGIESIERLAEEGLDVGGDGAASASGPPRDSKIRSLRNSIRLLSVVASLNSPKSKGGGGGGGGNGGGYTCGVPNSHLSACAQLYLAVVYKIERNDRVSAKHLLQVFADAPYLARRNLLPDLWEHFLLPHLLHLKVWYNKEVELVSDWEVADRDQRMKGMTIAYNDQMDAGTAQFALYYKEWLKIGGKAPPTPAVSLPSRPSYLEAWGNRSVSMSRSSVNRSLYQAVFGPSPGHDDIEDGLLAEDLRSVSQRELDINEATCKLGNLAHSGRGFSQRELHRLKDDAANDVAPEPRKSNSFRLLLCRSIPDTAAIHHAKTPRKDSTIVSKETENDVPSTNLGGAIALITGSDNLKECEAAVHAIAKAWLVSDGDAVVMRALSTSSVIEGLLEVTFTSKDEHVLELSISILAELVTRNQVNKQLILNADPQLEIFLRLLRSDNLFLNAAVVLYLLKPKAKQMLSLDWIPLVLRVLEYGDQIQTLFTVQSSPKSAAFYFLDQLLMGFDVDRNVENAKQLVVLGGLDLLIRGLQIGDERERKNSASLLARCIRADGSCRQYLAANIKKASVIQLLLGNQLKSNGSAISLLNELVCLNRTTKIIKFLKELKTDGCFNTMHVLLVYLQQAPLEQRPLAAALLIQLDLLGDPMQYSTYREEAIDSMVGALERNLHSKKVQENCKRALTLLGGRFSCLGEATAEEWLLKRAGASGSPSDSFRSKEIVIDEDTRSEQEEKATEDWLRKLSIILLRSGNKRFLVALSNCIADGTPSLAHACLVAVAWMTSSLASMHNVNNLQALACSVLAPRLFESLGYDRPQEERVLASLSLFNFTRHPECLPKLFPLDKETINSLQDLAQVTWTAKELLFACCS